MKIHNIVYRVHAVQRMWQRNITDEDVSCVLKEGSVIEEYADDQPYPSRLLMGWVKGRPLHLVIAENTEDGSIIVITAYQPDLNNWKPGFRERCL